VHPIWEKAQEAMLQVLNAVTVAELAVEAASPRVQLAASSY
jgi:DNA-binding IscR family transcriptional regulator